PEPSFGPYHRAAAVLSTFDRTTLRPDLAPGEAPGGDALDRLLSDSVPVVEAGRSRWRLVEPVRQEVLRRMGSPEALARALAANGSEPPDPARLMLEAYLRGDAPRLEEQTAVQVSG